MVEALARANRIGRALVTARPRCVEQRKRVEESMIPIFLLSVSILDTPKYEWKVEEMKLPFLFCAATVVVAK